MYLLKLLKKDVYFLLWVALLGVLNSALFSTLLLLVNGGMRNREIYGGMNLQLAVLFFGLMILSFVCRRQFQQYMIRFTNAVLFDLELFILQKLRGSEYEAFQHFDTTKAYTAMADIKVIAQLPRFFVDCLNNAVLVVISLVYLFYVSPVTALVLFGCAALLVVYYHYRNIHVTALLKRSRDLENDYYRYLNDLLSGFKEVKMNGRRSERMFSRFFQSNRKEARNLEAEASVIYMNNELLGSYGWFFLLGLIVFLLPLFFSLGAVGTTTFFVVILYLMAPVNGLITALPFVTRIRIALKRIQDFTSEIGGHAAEADAQALSSDDTFHSLNFSDVTYQYKEINRRGFTLGPVNLKIIKGEVVFITGENGSGKSTFLMLLSGLLKPASGEIFYNGQQLLPAQYPHYRNCLSAVFVDNFLFSENYDDFDLTESGVHWKEGLELLQLDEAVVSRKQKPTHLSKGQQKRLALIYALMENKDILVLDEWAAEQDPVFRAVFYREIVKKLQLAGKTIIAITHDDKYFSCADRVIKFKNGHVVSDQRMAITALYE